MTKEQKQSLSWLEWRSQVTGKPVEELRKEMSDKSKLADRTNSGFAALSPEQRRAIAAKGGHAGLGKKRKNAQKEANSK